MYLFYKGDNRKGCLHNSKPGEVVVMGPNGAGATTFNLAVGI